jgi:hypothetical protein
MAGAIRSGKTSQVFLTARVHSALLSASRRSRPCGIHPSRSDDNASGKRHQSRAVRVVWDGKTDLLPRSVRVPATTRNMRLVAGSCRARVHPRC